MAWIRIFRCHVQSAKRLAIESSTSDDRQGRSGIDVACSSLLDSSAVVQ